MRMKLGDMTLDARQGISFGEPQPARLAEPRRQPPPTSPDSPGPGAFFALAGLASTVLVALAALSLVWSPAAAIAVPGPAILLVGSLVMAARRRSHEDAPPPDPPSLHLERAARIAAALRARDQPATVEALIADTGWSEAAVLTGLAHLQAEGRLDEDLDLATGHWRYRLEPAGDDRDERAYLPLDERLERLESAPEPTTSLVTTSTEHKR